MAYSGYAWTPMVSMTAIKYQRPGIVEMKPFEPGERRRAIIQREKTIKGYKEVRKELMLLRRTMSAQKTLQQSLGKKAKTTFYQSPVRTRYDITT